MRCDQYKTSLIILDAGGEVAAKVNLQRAADTGGGCPTVGVRGSAMTSTLGSSVRYSGGANSSRWEGRVVTEVERFRQYVREAVCPRVADSESSFAADLRGLATTGMATEFVERLLVAVPEPESWEVGEALAECALKDDSGREVYWPWNSVCDRRTPRASLPGADLVGFCCEGDTVLLMFGEVKTSSDFKTPPGVMNGGSGMVWQLQECATRLDIQHALLRWLSVRCRVEPYRTLFKRAVSLYLESGGKELLLVGILIRDTTPNELDLKGRGEVLAQRLSMPTRIELIAWYLPVPISDWPKLLRADG